MKKIDIVIPVYGESPDIVTQTIERIRNAMAKLDTLKVQIIVIDDGSDPPMDLKMTATNNDLLQMHHNRNRGYGAAIKTGIKAGDAEWIGIVDADGTYPVEEIVNMCRYLDEADMIIGVRTGDINEIPWLRRLPKSMLNAFASYLSHERIVDINSGLRLFRRGLVEYLWELFPKGFSFTSTLTMGALLGGYRIVDFPINYYRRVGKSSIRPVSDTLRFFRIVMRLGLMFSPAKIFEPVAGTLFLAGALKGFFRDYPMLGYIGNFAVLLMLSGVQIAMMGLLGELIVHSRKLRNRTGF